MNEYLSGILRKEGNGYILQTFSSKCNLRYTDVNLEPFVGEQVQILYRMEGKSRWVLKIIKTETVPIEGTDYEFYKYLSPTLGRPEWVLRGDEAWIPQEDFIKACQKFRELVND